MYRFILAIAFVLAGCATAPPGDPAQIRPAQAVFAAKSAYAMALQAAVLYKRMPTCANGVRSLCSDPATVARMQAIDTASSGLLDEAEAAARTQAPGQGAAILAAQQAVAAFTTLTQSALTGGKP